MAQGLRIFLQCKRPRFNPWVRKIPWIREWKSTLVCLTGKFHRQRSLVGYSPWGHKESDTTEWLTLFSHFSYLYLSYIYIYFHIYILDLTKVINTRQKSQLFVILNSYLELLFKVIQDINTYINKFLYR